MPHFVECTEECKHDKNQTNMTATKRMEECSQDLSEWERCESQTFVCINTETKSEHHSYALPSPWTWNHDIEINNLVPPPDLEDFDEMFQRISDTDRPASYLMLTWITHAIRPLTLSEVRCISEIDSELVGSDIARMSGGLLTTDKRRNVSFVHPKAREFLCPLSQSKVGGSAWSVNPHEVIARTCLKAISGADILQILDCSVLISKAQQGHRYLAIRPYALENFMHHCNIADSSSKILQGEIHNLLKTTILEPEIRGFRHHSKPTLGISDKHSVVDANDANFNPLSPSAVALHHTVANTALAFAAQAGLTNLAKVELQMGADVNGIHGHHEFTPLHLAAMQGHIDVVRTLIQYDADPNRLSATGNTALHYAVAGCNHKITALLLENGAGISQDSVNCNAKRSFGSGQRNLQDFMLEISLSESCLHRELLRVHYTISSVPNHRIWGERDVLPEIHVTGKSIPRAEAGLSTLLVVEKHQSARTTDRIVIDRVTIKWFAGTSMHNALRIAARRGMSDVKRLLLAAGNDVDLIDGCTSLANSISKMSLLA